jgi:hypothetical protein
MLNGWKTVLASLVVVALGALQAAEGLDWIALVGDTWAGVIVAGIGALMLWLRSITSTPIFKKE